MQATNPVCVVLMNNATINLYYQVQTSNPTAQTPPAVLLMALRGASAGPTPAATGIAYEVPGVTAFVHLRSVIATPVNRVGVIYRPPFRAFIQRQTSLAAKEHVESHLRLRANDVTAAGLREALHSLAAEQSGRVWMLNDNGLVRDAEFVDDTWRTELSDAKMPLIVGVPNLVAPGSSLERWPSCLITRPWACRLRILCSTCRTMTGG